MRRSQENRTDMDEGHKRGIARASKVIENYTYPFLTTSERSEPELIASCIFVELEGKYFLVTAAHALRANRQGLFTRGNGRLIDVAGTTPFQRILIKTTSILRR